MYVIELLKRDGHLISGMSERGSDDKNIYRIFRERLTLYDGAADMPLIEDDRKFLEYRKSEVYHELRIFRFIQDRKKLVDTQILIETTEIV